MLNTTVRSIDLGPHFGPKVRKNETKKHGKSWSEQIMFLDAKGFQNRAKMLPEIYEKTLQKTMPKTRRPIIKNIIKNEVPEPQKTLFSLRKNNIFANSTKLEHNQTNMKKRHQKAFQNHEKTFKKSMQKRTWKKYDKMMPKSSKMGAKRTPKINQKQTKT